MKRQLLILSVIIISVLLLANTFSELKDNSKDYLETSFHYPDFGAMLSPNDYNGRVFRLSQDFPKTMPKKEDDKALMKILSMDFKKDWKSYAMAVRDYVLEGNINAAITKQHDYNKDFFLEDNKVRDWYHVPWQHWGPHGREGFHGLTQEGPVGDQMLASTQHSKTHAYAVGFYNDLGGYTIGQMWHEEEPDFDYFKQGKGFPIGTVVGKILFVPLSENEVPYLTNPVNWDAYIYEKDVPKYNFHANKNKFVQGSRAKNASNPRVQSTVNLIQMDIMVRDPRATTTGGWVFGTFVYQGELNNQNRWENLMPVGIMWGNDPKYNTASYNPTPTKTIINSNLKETVINTDSKMPAMHLGFGSRLNGPVDNAYSSCMSCHSVAEYPSITGILPQFGPENLPIPKEGTAADEKWMRYFQNIPCATPIDKEAISLDYSLQLVKSVENYIEYIATTKDGHFAEQYDANGANIRRNVIDDSK